MEILQGKRTIGKDLNNQIGIKSLIGLIIGILLEHKFHFGLWCGMAGTAVCIASLLLINKSRNFSRTLKYRFILGPLFYLSWISFGIFITDYQTREKTDINKYQDCVKVGLVTSSTESKAKSFKTTLLIKDTAIGTEDEILAYIEKDSLAPIPQLGDLIAFESDLRYMKSTGNPFEFDYAEYMSKQGIYAQTYIKTNEFEIIVPSYSKGLKYYSCKARDFLIDIYRNAGFTSQQLAILEALTLGYKNDLDQETIAAFQASGAMHILAVSGLHTGIIMMITTMILNMFGKYDNARYFKFVIAMVLLWGFAFITGLSSSVCRSALMFTFILVKQYLNKEGNTYHAIGISALILLILNPMLIFNVGFGLSYTAVVAIVAIIPIYEKLTDKKCYKKLQGWQIVKDKIWKYFTGIVAVSVAAQIGTCVLSIATFGTFPTYFILTNIAVIPLAYFIMMTAILIAITSWWSPLCGMMISVMKLWLNMLTGSVSTIECLPGSCIRNIFLNGYTAILIYVLIAMVILSVKYRHYMMSKLSLIPLCLIVISMIAIDTCRNMDEQIIIYNTNNYSMLSIFQNGKMTIIAPQDKMDARNLSSPMAVAQFKKAKEIEYISTDSISTIEQCFFRVGGKNFLIGKALPILKHIEPADSLNIDYLIVSNNTFINTNDIKEKINVETIIYDASCSYQYIESHIDDMVQNNMKYVDISSEGYFCHGDHQSMKLLF